MYEITITWTAGMEKTEVVPRYGFEKEDRYFWTEEENAIGDVLLKIYPLNTILKIVVVVPKELIEKNE